MWRALLPDKLAPLLSLDRVLASRAGDRMVVMLNASRLLTGTEFYEIRDALRSAFPGAVLSLRVAYPDMKEAVEQDVASVVPFMTALLLRELPGATPYLKQKDGAWTLRDGLLTIDVGDPFGVDFLTRKAADLRVAELMRALFHVECRARFEASGDIEKRLRSIEEKRVAEAQRMAEDAARVAQIAQTRKPVGPKELFGKPVADPPIAIDTLTEQSGRIILRGEVVRFESRDLKNGETKLVTFSLTDYTGTVACKLFLGGKRGKPDPAQIKERYDLLAEALKIGAWATARGDYRYDEYQHEMVLHVTDLDRAAPPPPRADTAPVKRVELHMHTQMSAMDACASPTDLIARVASWGHTSVAITDHGVVQAFPEAFNAAKKKGIKLIPGCEGYLIDDRALIVERADDRPLAETTFVVFDLETTGLSPVADRITEIGAVRYEHGEEVAAFSQLINPRMPIPEKVVEITGITDAMVADMPVIEDVIESFHDFCKGAVLCAHNASFDWAFISRAFADKGLVCDAPVLDTLALSRNVLKGQRVHKLSAICKTLGVSLKDAHRAVHDARATARAMTIMLAGVDGARLLSDLNCVFDGETSASRHIILLAATQAGMANLYRLVSEAHLHHFYRTPRMPRSLIERYREGLIIGSACEAGELYRAVLDNKPLKELKRIASFYDYLEIQPTGNNQFLIREGKVEDEEALRAINRKIVKLGEQCGKPVVATCDVHFMEERDAIYRAILMNAKGFDDADNQPPLYLRTTDEMLKEFAYLGEETARRVVVDAPNEIASRVGDLTIFVKHPEGKSTFQPFWDFAEDDIRNLTEQKARDVYGEPLPEIVRARVDKELGSIIGYGFSTLYDIAVKLVAKSLSDGYIVGSRGSVGSSFVAWATGITEVNALPPHYVCPACRHSEFDVPAQYTCGLDLPEKVCPACGTPMNRDGFNIPFEVFLGFKGDKVPDIDLNFSGEYQTRAHAYVKELFGAQNVFRAGTIGTVAEKTAFGFVLKYLEQRGKTASNAEKERLALGCTGVKRTTGQHPAGMVVLPKDYEIYQFTPIQHPADDLESDTVTTHFDFSSMHDILVKLDILGHDDPTMLKKLQDLTGIPPREVPLHDPTVFARILSLFQSPEALGVTAEELGVKTGTLGIPEFGTKFVRQMLADTQPSTMEELIRISGLSHGTDVWVGNAQDLVRSGTAPLRQCICTRDDIMNQLMAWGVPSLTAFTTMEAVRKGKGLKPDMEEAMRAVDTPAWFIDSCKKIKYMFPKAHAVAYVTMALRIAYFKIYYPVEYYACYLARNREDFDALRMIVPLDITRERLAEANRLEKNEKAKKEGEISLLETLIEMALRGIEMLPIDLYESAAADFIVVDKTHIRPPISALPGLGMAAAENLVKARAEGRFISQEDMTRRKVAKSVIDLLRQAGALGDMPLTGQVSLFE